MPPEAPRVAVDDEFPEDSPALSSRPPRRVRRSPTLSASASAARSRGSSATSRSGCSSRSLLICAVMSYMFPAAFATTENFYNITRNFAFIGIMALGMTAVIITGGIDLSVGSIMGVVGDRRRPDPAGRISVVAGDVRGAVRRPGGGTDQRLFRRLCRAVAVRRDAGHAVGRRVRSRSCMSQNKMIYEFGP